LSYHLHIDLKHRAEVGKEFLQTVVNITSHLINEWVYKVY
jgi:hypothetical protein